MTTQTTDVTSAEPSTYTSSSLARFAWNEDPFGDNGFLHVEFQEGGRYVYIGVPEELAEGLHKRAENPDDYEDSVGEFFYSRVRNRFDRRGEEYKAL